MHAQSLQSCLTLCDPMVWSWPGSSVHGIFQARILEWVACYPPGDIPDPRINPCFNVSCTSGRFFTTEPIRETLYRSLSFIRGSLRDFLSLSSLQPSFLPPASDRSALSFNTLCSFTRIKGLNAEGKLATNLSGSFLASSGLLETCVMIQPFTTQGRL